MRSSATLRNLRLGWLIVLALTVGCGKDSRPADTERSLAKGPAWFEDFTARANITFVHQAETSGRHLFSESIGSGAAFLDFDNDGRLDLYLIHNVHPSASATNSLFQQQPDGKGSVNGMSVNGIDISSGSVVRSVNTTIPLTDPILTPFLMRHECDWRRRWLSAV